MPTSGGPGAITGQANKSSTVTEFLSNAYTALELAIKLAPLVPVPFVSSMLASAQVIVDAANVSRTLLNCVLPYIRLRGVDTFFVYKNMHDNKLQSAELAEYAAQLTCEVHRVIRGRERLVDGDLKTALEQLQTYGVNHSRSHLLLIVRSSRLTETKDIMEGQVNLNWWQRIAKRRTLADKLSACKNNLQYSMSTFAVGL